MRKIRFERKSRIYQLFKKLGYNILEAGSGKEAIQLYSEKIGKIDMVILLKTV